MYEVQLERLKFIIDNWGNHDVLANSFNLTDGVCVTCEFHSIPSSVVKHMISSFKYFCGDYGFPVGGVHEYRDNVDLYNNPMRLEFAKHCHNHLTKLRDEHYRQLDVRLNVIKAKDALDKYKATKDRQMKIDLIENYHKRFNRDVTKVLVSLLLVVVYIIIMEFFILK